MFCNRHRRCNYSSVNIYDCSWTESRNFWSVFFRSPILLKRRSHNRAQLVLTFAVFYFFPVDTVQRKDEPSSTEATKKEIPPKKEERTQPVGAPSTSKPVATTARVSQSSGDTLPITETLQKVTIKPDVTEEQDEQPSKKKKNKKKKKKEPQPEDSTSSIQHGAAPAQSSSTASTDFSKATGKSVQPSKESGTHSKTESSG